MLKILNFFYMLHRYPIKVDCSSFVLCPLLAPTLPRCFWSSHQRNKTYMLLIFSKPSLIRHMCQLKTVDFLHRCLICAVLLTTCVMGKWEEAKLRARTSGCRNETNLCRKISSGSDLLRKLNFGVFVFSLWWRFYKTLFVNEWLHLWPVL